MRDFYLLIKVLVATMLFDIKRSFFNRADKVTSFSGIHIENEFLKETDVDLIYQEIKDIVLSKDENNSEALIQNRGANGHDEGMLDIKHIDSVIPDLFERVNIDEIHSIVQRELGLSLTVSNMNCYWNKGVKNTRGFHADNHTKDQYKAFVYLTDVLDDSYGPYCYVPGSQLASFNRYKCIISNYLKNKPLTDYYANNQDIKFLKAKAPKGTLIISNQNGAHRGWPQEHDKERALISINLI